MAPNPGVGCRGSELTTGLVGLLREFQVQKTLSQSLVGVKDVSGIDWCSNP